MQGIWFTLFDSVATSQRIEYLPWTPIVHYTREKCLFFIIRDVWTKSIDDTLVVAIPKHSDFRLEHSWFERLEYPTKGGVKKLPPEIPKACLACMFSCGYTKY